jgi:hypothetical protein
MTDVDRLIAELIVLDRGGGVGERAHKAIAEAAAQLRADHPEAVVQTETCPRCNGSGGLRVDEPECNGGLISARCERCGGSGRVPVVAPKPDFAAQAEAVERALEEVTADSGCVTFDSEETHQEEIAALSAAARTLRALDRRADIQENAMTTDPQTQRNRDMIDTLDGMSYASVQKLPADTRAAYCAAVAAELALLHRLEVLLTPPSSEVPF